MPFPPDNYKKIRVLMFVPKYPDPIVGGLEKQAQILACELSKMDVDILVLSGKFNSEQSSESLENGVKVFRFQFIQNRWLRYALSPILIFFQFIKLRKRFDLVHLHQNSSMGLYVILLSKIFNKPVLTKLPNIGSKGIPGILNSTLGSLKCWILKKSDSIIAMTKESISELKSINYAENHIFFTPNGVQTKDIDNTYSNSDDSRCKVVFLGRLTEQKDPFTLLKAWRLVINDQSHQAKLEIWGEGELMEELVQLSKQLNLWDRVHFAGYVPQAAKKLKSMDILVLPSLIEGNSNSILESMAAGLCIISTPVGGTPLLLGNEAKDFLIDVGNEKELSEKLLVLIMDKALRQKLSKEMHQRVKRFFDIQVVASNYLKVYQLLIDGQNKSVGAFSESIMNNLE